MLNPQLIPFNLPQFLEHFHLGFNEKRNKNNTN